MGHHETGEALEPSRPKAVVSSDRADQISRENQVGLPATSKQGSMNDGGSWLKFPSLELFSKNGGPDQIDDCSKGKCIVGGKQYKDSTEIPGNHPKQLVHTDGKPVLGPDGMPVFGPDKIDLDKIATHARDNQGLLSLPEALNNFRHSGAWDFQRVQSDDGKPIWTEKYQNFSNIGIGYIMGALGLNLDQMSKYADKYCSLFCNYNEPMSPKYPNLADRQVKDFQIGVDLYKERHPTDK